MTRQADHTADEQPNPAANGTADIAAQCGIDPETWKTLSIEDQFRAVVADASQTERDKLPPDFGENLEHYLYGTPKIDERPEDPFVFDPTAPTIAEMVEQCFADVPDEEWDLLPTDLAERHDDYLTGRLRL